MPLDHHLVLHITHLYDDMSSERLLGTCSRQSSR